MCACTDCLHHWADECSARRCGCCQIYKDDCLSHDLIEDRELDDDDLLDDDDWDDP